MNPAQPQLLTIQEAARVLNVSTKTLRRWESAGILTPASRTEGNQRRYTLEQVSNFEKPQAVSLSPLTSPFEPEPQNPVSSHFSPAASRFSIAHLLVPAQKAILASLAIFALLFLGGTLVVKSPQVAQGIKRIALIIGISANSFDQAQNKLAGMSGAILGSTTNFEELLFNVNIAANFADDVVIEGNLTAPNILYSIIAGEGINITPGQTPTISTTDQTADLNIFSSFKVGSDTISSSGKTDTLEFVSGSNVSLSADTSGKKITINASATDVTTSGWTDDGTILRLTTAGDLVSIGSATGSAKLSIEGDGYAGDVFTASHSGNLLLKLTNTGRFDVATTGFNAGIKLQNASTFFSGTGAPSNTDGTDGDYYFRTDAPNGNLSTYVKVAGVWVTSGGGSTTLQDAYDAGNTIVTDDNKHLDFTLADTTIDSNFLVNIATGSTGSFQVQNNGVTVTTLDINGITSTGTLNLTNLASGAVFSNAGVISSEAQLDETRGGTGIGTYAAGDTLYASGVNTLAKLGIGSDGQVLTAMSGVPTWAGGSGSGSGSIGWWQRNAGVVSPTNITDDLTIGGTATSSAQFHVNSQTGDIMVGNYIRSTLNNVNNINLYNGGISLESYLSAGFNLDNDNNDTGEVFRVVTDGATNELFRVQGNNETYFNGAASISGILSVGSSIGNQDMASLVLGNSTTGNIEIAAGRVLVTPAFQMTTGAVDGYVLTSDANGLASWTDTTGTGSFGAWTLTGQTIFPNSDAYSLLLGSESVADDIGKFTISGTKTGKALAVLNDTGTDQNILTASASGITKFTLDRSGNITLYGGLYGDAGLVNINDTLVINDGFRMPAGAGSGYVMVSDGSGNGSWTDLTTTGNLGPWSLSGDTLYPDQANYNLLIGSVSTPDDIGKFTVSGAKTGKALAVFNQTGNQNIITASASGITKYFLDISGNSSQSGNITLESAGILQTTRNQSLSLNPTGGNVGIGTSNPTAKLQVGDSTGQGTLAKIYGISSQAVSLQIGSSGEEGSGNLILESQSNGGGNGIRIVTNRGNMPSFKIGYANNSGNGTGGDLDLGYFGNYGDSINFRQANSIKVTIDSSGNVGVGTVLTNAKFTIDGQAGAAGNALVILNQTDLTGNILNASAGGATRFTLTSDGSATQSATSLTGVGYTLNANSLTSGTGLFLSSTSTALTSGSLLSGYWNPGSSTTATGNLFNFNVGANALVSGNIFNVQDNASDLFSVNQSQIVANLPTSFTSVGDVSMSYDLQFTNPTASYINSAAPLYIQAGEVFNSSDLTLTTFNVGNILANTQAFVVNGSATVSGKTVLGTTTAVPTPNSFGSLYVTNPGTYGKALVVLNQTESADIFTASASGTSRFVINNAGNVGIGTTTPTQQLHVYNATTGAVALLESGVNNTAHINYKNNVKSYLVGLSVGGTNAFQIYDNTVGAFRLTVDTTGNVGINTITPLATLDVRGNSGITPVASISGQTAFAAMVVDNSGVGDLFTASKSGATKFVITNAGNVGIGTTLPTNTLEVAGTFRAGVAAPTNRYVSVNSNGVLSARYDDNSIRTAFNLENRDAGTGDEGVSMLFNLARASGGGTAISAGQIVVQKEQVWTSTASTQDSYMAFSTALNGTLTERFRLTSDGTSSMSGALTLTTTPTIQSTVNQTLTLGGNTTGNIALMPLNGSGNVGIGTVSPSKILHLASTGSLTLGMEATSGTFPGSIQLNYDPAGSAQVMWSNTVAFKFATVSNFAGDSYSEKMRITSGGNVGINASSPLATLDVRGNSGITPVASISGQTSFAAMVVDNRGIGDIFTASSSGLSRFVITQNGDVGIGTNIPLAKLNINGSTNGAGIFVNSTSANSTVVNGLRIHNNGSGTNTGSSLWLGYGTAIGHTAVVSGFYDGVGAAFSIATGTSNTERLRIDASGNFGIGTTTPIGKFVISGQAAAGGNALGIFNQTDSTGAILTASGSGTTRFTLGSDGSIVQTPTTTTGTGYAMNMNSLTTGFGMGISSTSTALTTGRLMNLDWSPTTPATASGDLFRLNIGSLGDITGNYFNITDNGTSLFSVSDTAVTTSLPTAFNAAGDVSMAYDQIFTNQTASYLKSNATLNIESGETFESNDLNLTTFNSGKINLTGSQIAIWSTSATNPYTSYNMAGSANMWWMGGNNSNSDFVIGNTAIGIDANVKFQIRTSGAMFITGSESATSAATIYNSNTGNDADGLTIKLGVAQASVGTACNTSGGACNEYITFLDGNGRKLGKIHANSAAPTVTYKANGLDLAEYFTKVSGPVFEAGDIVNAPETDLNKSATAYDPKLIGIVSTAPSFVGGVEGDNKVLVGITGQVPTKIAASSSPIKKGDFITSSTVAGRGMKATKPGFVIGKALEDWNPGGADKILVYINVTWADPTNSLAFDDAGNITINGTVTAQNFIAKDNPVDTLSPEVANLRSSLTTLDSQIVGLQDEIASMSARLDALEIQNDPGASLSADLWTLATDSGKLTSIYSVQVPELNVLGPLHVGLLTIDDLSSTISSLLGEITIDGDLAVSGSINVLGASAGKALLPAGETFLEIDTSYVSPTSAVFATPEKLPTAISTESTESGKFVLRIPEALFDDLTVNWWVIN